MTLAMYTVTWPDGRSTIMQLNEKDAERLGAKPVKAAAQRANKARTPATKEST